MKTWVLGNRRPRHTEIDWHRTIRANLRHWQPEYRTVVSRQLHDYVRKARRPQREVVLCIDQSGSMANSVTAAAVRREVIGPGRRGRGWWRIERKRSRA